jgi:hypothetical protein
VSEGGRSRCLLKERTKSRLPSVRTRPTHLGLRADEGAAGRILINTSGNCLSVHDVNDEREEVRV